jgi:RNA polymerase sigma-70 factor (ECF subfamily)
MGVVRHVGVRDAELLAAARSDADAFASFYDRYETAIVGYLMRRTGDAELAADLTAEVFAAAFAAASRYRPEAPTAAGWLFTIAHNTLATSLRRGRVEARARRRLGIRDALEFASDDLERIEAAASGESWVSELLERLPAEQREAIRARILDEQSYREIATRLRTSQLVVRKRVSRGLATLREELEDPS